ncbi:hypothetical protein [Granulibacter bethesdensis]|uniref:hypothetical protein n=1 Tax=Granulibacter bethesdensis TaxID=364410 RepID=UPI0012FD7ADE|nr:hypothetical protein [Granulibacter bethesdensis]
MNSFHKWASFVAHYHSITCQHVRMIGMECERTNRRGFPWRFQGVEGYLTFFTALRWYFW